MKRVLWSLGFCALSTLALSAATLVPGPTDTNPDTALTATLDLSGPTLNFATPGGPDTLSVFGDLSNFLGNVVATDGGTPGQVILSLNTGGTELVSLSFNTALAQVLGTNLLVPATGAAVTTVTDPALQALIGASTFSFASAGSTQNPFVFDFTTAALPASSVPEPAVAFTIGVGLIAISALRLRKKPH